MKNQEENNTKPAVLETEPKAISTDQMLTDADLDQVSGGATRRRTYDPDSFTAIPGRSSVRPW